MYTVSLTSAFQLWPAMQPCSRLASVNALPLSSILQQPSELFAYRHPPLLPNENSLHPSLASHSARQPSASVADP